MAKRPKLHFRDGQANVCGRKEGADGTTDPHAVTCLDCRSTDAWLAMYRATIWNNETDAGTSIVEAFK